MNQGGDLAGSQDAKLTDPPTSIAFAPFLSFS